MKFNWKSFLTIFKIFQARELASKHEHEADKIEETVHGALNNSKKATEVTRDAVVALNKTYIDLADILRRLRKVERLSQVTQGNATSAKERAEASLSDAEDIYKNATAPLPDIGLDELRSNYALFISFLICLTFLVL